MNNLHNTRIKYISILLLIIISTLFLSACADNPETLETNANASVENGSNKIQIVTTLFPTYDFTRQVVGDKADVTLLLPPGVESHTFEPTPQDIIKINECDLFIYTGKNMEIWAENIIENISADTVVLDVSQGITLKKSNEAEYNENPIVENDEHHEYDPHIWTDPVNAKIMVQNITDSLCQIDPLNAEYYKENSQNYLNELDKLDKNFQEIVENGKRKEIYFGERFAMYYFTDRYGLTCVSAYDNCSADSEPTAENMAFMIEEINEKSIPVIYYQELSDPKVSKIISEETGAEMLLLHSAHNVSKEDFENGVTYLDLMEQNAVNLEKGLN